MTGLCLYKLQSRTDSISCRICSAAEKGIRHAHFYKHSAEIIGMLQGLARHFRRHALLLPELNEHIDHLVKSVIILRIYYLSSPDIESVLFSGRLHFLRISNKYGLQEISCQKTRCSFENPGIFAFREDYCLRILLQLFDHCTKTKTWHNLPLSIYTFIYVFCIQSTKSCQEPGKYPL